MTRTHRAAVVGSGPNGLAAAVTLARRGIDVTVFERHSAYGGGTRTAALTLPGFLHDVCSAAHPLALASPFFRESGLLKSIELCTPEVSYAHVVSPARIGLAYRDLDRTAAGLGPDGKAWTRAFAPLVAAWEQVGDIATAHLLRGLPAPLLTMARLGSRVAWQMARTPGLRGDIAPAMLAGVAAHAIAPTTRPIPAGVGIVLAALAHATGWPMIRGGSGRIADAMVAELNELSGSIVTDAPIGDLRELSGFDAILLDVGARSAAQIGADTFPHRYLRALNRQRHSGGAAKVDFALSSPVPWANSDLALAGTIHLGGTAGQVRAAERATVRGIHVDQPVMLLGQPGSVDDSRAPAGAATLWSYVHVPNGSTLDAAELVTCSVERLAPGFRDTILATSTGSAEELGRYNPNYTGGDINSGDLTVAGLLARPVLSFTPWRTPVDGVYLCSSATPPGPGVHGMAGHWAARTALRDVWGLRS